MKILAVGDIHTKKWIVDEVEKLVSKYDIIVFCGDYADDWGKDGLESIDTWHKLYLLAHSNENIKLVLGNHDFIYINKTPTLQSGYNPITQLSINSPAYNYLREWLLSLPITIEEGGITFSHAGIARGWGGTTEMDDLWQDSSPIWVRPNRAEYERIPQVFGHTPSATCWEVHPEIWCIDTFSTNQWGNPIGDQTALEITVTKNKRKYKKIKLNEPT
tara:strand:+ start:4066 stop:4716 length:651 start_codon:yes stop_codon:yes gene_type:complete